MGCTPLLFPLSVCSSAYRAGGEERSALHLWLPPLPCWMRPTAMQTKRLAGYRRFDYRLRRSVFSLPSTACHFRAILSVDPVAHICAIKRTTVIILHTAVTKAEFLPSYINRPSNSCGSQWDGSGRDYGTPGLSGSQPPFYITNQLKTHSGPVD